MYYVNYIFLTIKKKKKELSSLLSFLVQNKYMYENNQLPTLLTLAAMVFR